MKNQNKYESKKYQEKNADLKNQIVKIKESMKAELDQKMNELSQDKQGELSLLTQNHTN